MEFIESKIIEILQQLPSEAPNLDYKEMPYHKSHDLDFIKDVIAMLNAEAAMNEDKFIIVGVDNSKNLKGIEARLWRDDNEWQNLIKKITPRPIDVRTGTVEFDNKLFGYIYISPLNDEWVYEAGETILPKDGQLVKKSNTLFEGQAMTRIGSTNEVLHSKGRQRLLDKKIQSFQVQPPMIKSGFDESLLGALALIGAWNENYSSDIEAIEKITGETYKAIVEKLRSYYSSEQDIFIFSNGIWRIKNHCEVLLQEADKIYDNHIVVLFQIIRECFFEIDYKYNLPEDKRVMSAIYEKEETMNYSRAINKGIAETLAIIGNNQEVFINCSSNKILTDIYLFERDFFKAEDWKIFATEADNMQFLGEAYPDVFLDEIIRLTSEQDNAFLDYLNGREDGIFTTQYGYQLSWVLANIAKIEKYFSRAVNALFQLAQINELFVDTIVGIVLPWYPQTHASIAVRIGIFNGLAKEDNKLTWKILMKLMPGVTTTGSPIIKPEYLRIEELPEKISQKDYVDATVGYINLAIEMIDTDVQQMCDLISVIDDVDMDLQEKITYKIKAASKILSQTDKEELWNKVQDFLVMHRKFSDSNWALPEERLVPLEHLVSDILSDSKHAYEIRMFRKEQFSLYENRDNFRNEEKKFRVKQIGILKNIYAQNGINGILEFSEEVENKYLLGSCISTFISDIDISNIISKSKHIEKDSLIRGIFTNLNYTRCLAIIKNKSDDIQARILTFVPITEEVVIKVQELNEAAQCLYWSLNSVRGFIIDRVELCENIVKNFNRVGRTDNSILILYNCILNEHMDVVPDLVIDTLNQHVEVNIQGAESLQEFYVQNLIKWLQEHDADKNRMVIIEWEYLVCLNESDGYAPIYLWNELSTNPDYYIGIMKWISGKENDFKGTEEEKNRIITQCYRLMFSWKKTPGMCMDGSFNDEILERWMEVVVKKSKAIGIQNIAMNYFGKAAFHAPKDKDGFFIERNVAKYLQNDKDGHALSGYFNESINSRGIHAVDKTGEAEFAIEAVYLQKVIAAEEAGLFRFAATLRKIAKSYHEDGERNKEGTYWNEE